jgi:hypothetical protein
VAQHPPYGRLVRRAVLVGTRVAADPQRGQGVLGGVGDPLADRDERAGTRSHRHAATASTVATAWRTPRRRRGSGTVPRWASRSPGRRSSPNLRVNRA